MYVSYYTEYISIVSASRLARICDFSNTTVAEYRTELLQYHPATLAAHCLPAWARGYVPSAPNLAIEL